MTSADEEGSGGGGRTRRTRAKTAKKKSAKDAWATATANTRVKVSGVGRGAKSADLPPEREPLPKSLVIFWGDPLHPNPNRVEIEVDPSGQARNYVSYVVGSEQEAVRRARAWMKRLASALDAENTSSATGKKAATARSAASPPDKSTT